MQVSRIANNSLIIHLSKIGDNITDAIFPVKIMLMSGFREIFEYRQHKS